MHQMIWVNRLVDVSSTKRKSAFGHKNAIVSYELGVHGEQVCHMDMNDQLELIEKHPDYLIHFNKRFHTTRSN